MGWIHSIEYYFFALHQINMKSGTFLVDFFVDCLSKERISSNQKVFKKTRINIGFNKSKLD